MGRQIRSPRETSTSSAQPNGHRHGRVGLVDGTAEGIDPGHRGGQPRRQDHHLVAGPEDTTGHPAGIAAIVGLTGGLGPDHPLDGQPGIDQVAVRGDVDLLEVVEERCPFVPGHIARALDHIVALERRDGDEAEVGHVQPAGEGRELLADRLEHVAVVTDQVHLVDAQEEVGNPEQRGQEGVTTGLFHDALARVDQHDGQVGGRIPRHHVPGVLDVAGGVGDDELPGRGGEVAVGHIDGDPLLALGPQTVGEEGQVGVLVATLAADALHRLQLVLEDGLGVEEQPTDQRALPVVHRSCRSQAEQLHQKYPSRLRSSMAASLTRSSARVAPRSVSREAATSMTMSSAETAVDSTAPVQVMSPTVR